MRWATRYIFIPFIISLLVLSFCQSEALAHPNTPVYWITFPIAGVNSYSDSFGVPRPGGRTHQGVDIFAAKCTPLVACVSGYIDPSMFGFHPTAGYRLWINGIDGHRYFYAHLNNDTPGTDNGVGGPTYAPGIGPGAWVNAGQPIGYVGDSGNAEGTSSHLHFEIHPNWGSAICPHPSLLSSSQPSWAHHVTYTSHSTPSSMQSNEYKGDIPITVTNTGIATWPAQGGAPVRLSYHWVDPSTYRTIHFEGLRTSLPYDVAPSQSVNLLAQVQAPSSPGMYILRWDMVQENISWFSQRCVLCLDVRVGVSYKGDAEYATSLYERILIRQPDAPGLAGWTNALGSGTSRTTLAYYLLNSPERSKLFAAALYQNILGRSPDSSGLAAWSEALKDGVGDETAEALFYGSDEYFSYRISPSTNEQYVTSLYQRILGRTPLEIETQTWVNVLNSGWSRTKLAIIFINSHEAHINLVNVLYLQILERPADAAGLNNWVTALDRGSSRREAIGCFYGCFEYSLVK